MRNSKYLILFLLLFGLSSALNAQNGLDTDGIDDAATALSASALIAGSNQITMTMWVFPRNLNAGWPDFDGFGGIRNELSADFYLLQLNSNQVEARFRNSGGTDYTFTFDSLQLNTWNHFVLMYNGTNLIGYHNGQFEKQISATGTILSTTEGFHVGWVPFQSTHFYTDGMVDEVSLWDRTLTAGEIECLYYSGINQPDTALKLYYKMDQGIAGGNNTGITTLVDSAGNIDASLTGFALTGNASNFVAGVPQYIDIQDTICSGDSSLFDGVYYHNAGIYRNVYSASNGCDSIRQLTLRVGNTSFATVFDTTCSGSNYTFPDGTTINNINSSMVQTSNLFSPLGCDSTIVTDLFVYTIPTTNVLDTVCNGDSYTFPDGTTQNNISSPVSQTSVLSTSLGCDSAVVTDLAVVTLDTTVSFIPPATLSSNMNNASYQWILCHVLNIPAQGEIFQTFTPTNPGSYAVVVSSGGCVDTSGCHSVDPTSLEMDLSSIFNVFPNPAAKALTIECSEFQMPSEFELVDALGRVVLKGKLEQKKEMIPVSDLPSGHYLIRINSGESYFSKRIRIE